MQLAYNRQFLFPFLTALMIICYSKIHASKLNNARVCSCVLELSHPYCSIVRMIPGMVLARGIQCSVKRFSSQTGELSKMIPNRQFGYEHPALEAERVQKYGQKLFCAISLTSVSGNSSVTFLSLVQMWLGTSASQWRPSINLQGKELGCWY